MSLSRAELDNQLQEDHARTPCAALRALAALVAQARVDLANEKASQADLNALLIAAYSAERVSREHRLGPGDIPDFLIDGRFIIEMKGMRHRADPVVRQLLRYARHDQVEGMVLATARAMVLPPQIGGKPLLVVNLGRAWL